MSREDPQLRVRIPERLKLELENRASVNRRSLTAEIIDRLEITLYDDNSYGGTKEYLFNQHRIGLLEHELADLKRENASLRLGQGTIDYSLSTKEELKVIVEKLLGLINRLQE